MREFAKRLRTLGLSRFILSIGLAMISGVLAVYLKEIVFSDSLVSLITGLISLAGIIFSISSANIIAKFRSKKILLSAMVFFIIAYVVMGFFKSLSLFLIAAVVMISADIMRRHSFGELTRHQANNQKQLFLAENVTYTVSNVSYVIGPLLIALLIEKNTSLIFFGAACCMIINWFIVKFGNLRDVEKEEKEEPHKVLSNVGEFFSNKMLRKAYVFNLGLCMWWSVLFVTTPLYIIHEGFPKSMVGAVLSAVIIPVVIIEFFSGKFGKKIPERWFFALGFGFLAAVSFAAFVVKSPALTIGLIVSSGVGAGLIEPVQETFFFKKVKPKNEKRFFSVFITSMGTGSMLGKFIGAILLALFPFKVVFLGFGILMSLIFLEAISLYFPKNKKHHHRLDVDYHNVIRVQKRKM